MEHPWLYVLLAVSCPRGAGSLLGLVPVSLVCTGQQMRQEVRSERRQELGRYRYVHRCDTYQEKDFTCS